MSASAALYAANSSVEIARRFRTQRLTVAPRRTSAMTNSVAPVIVARDYRSGSCEGRAHGVGDVIDLRIGQLRIHRQRENAAGGGLGGRKHADAISERRAGLLQVRRHRI